MKNTLILASLVGVLGIGSIASADRGYSGHGGDRYSAQRYEASARYGQGSRNYDRTYSRYGQATYGLRSDYGRDYRNRYDAGYRSYGSRSRYSSSNFSFGFYGGDGFYGDSVSLGFGYSSGPRYYSPAPVYRYRDYGPPAVIYDRDYCPPSSYYYSPSYYVEPSYGRGFVYSYSSRGYYGR